VLQCFVKNVAIAYPKDSVVVAIFKVAVALARLAPLATAIVFQLSVHVVYHFVVKFHASSIFWDAIFALTGRLFLAVRTQSGN